MKTLLSVFLLVFFVFSFDRLTAQDLEGIIDSHIKAMGGKEKLATLKTVKMTGAMSVQGTDISIVSNKTQLSGSRMDIEVAGTTNYQYLTNISGKVYMPIMGMAGPEEMQGGELQMAITQLDIQSPFLDYKEKGNKIVLIGKEKLDNADTWKLLVTFKTGKAISYYLDASTYRVAKIASVESANGVESVIEFSYGDYKQNADGYWFPYSVTNSHGTISFDKIETNVPIDEKIYSN